MRAQPSTSGLGPLAPAESSPRTSGDPLPEPAWRAQTSHSWRLSGSSFALDLSWSRQEGPDLPSTALYTAETANLSREPAPTRVYQGREPASFAEVLRRQQLAGLLMTPYQPPPQRVLMQNPYPSFPASPGQVNRAYTQGLGPLAAPSSLCFIV